MSAITKETSQERNLWNHIRCGSTRCLKTYGYHFTAVSQQHAAQACHLLKQEFRADFLV